MLNKMLTKIFSLRRGGEGGLPGRAFSFVAGFVFSGVVFFTVVFFIIVFFIM